MLVPNKSTTTGTMQCFKAFSFFNIFFRRKAKIIDGVAMAKDIKNEVKGEVDEMVAAGLRPPHLTAVIVGDDPASHTYVKNKMKAATYTG